MNSIVMNFTNNADVNAAYNHLRVLYPNARMTKSNINIDELVADEYLFNIAAKRKSNDSGKRISFEEHLAKRGLSVADIEAMEDVELE